MSLNLGSAPSLWQQTAVDLPLLDRLTDDITADVTIVGASFTGLRAALELAQQGVDVVVLDSHEPEWGLETEWWAGKSDGTFLTG